MTLVVGELGADPGVDDLQSQILADHTGTQSHDVGVVVQAGHLGGPGLVQQSAADTVDLVGGDGSADAGGAQDDALLALAAGDSLGSGGDHVGIVAAGQGVAAKVDDLVTLSSQVRLHIILQVECAVITCDGNFHW